MSRAGAPRAGALRWAAGLTVVAGLAATGCVDEAQPEFSCACEDAICREGRCALRVINECPDVWGEARVFVNDTGPEAQPAGISTASSPYEDCHGFAVGQGFQFIVESENARTISETAGATFMCDGNVPFEFRLGCP